MSRQSFTSSSCWIASPATTQPWCSCWGCCGEQASLKMEPSSLQRQRQLQAGSQLLLQQRAGLHAAACWLHLRLFQLRLRPLQPLQATAKQTLMRACSTARACCSGEHGCRQLLAAATACAQRCGLSCYMDVSLHQLQVQYSR